MISSNITALIPCPDKKGRVDVYADGELLMTLSEDAVIEAGLRVGKTVDANSLLEIEKTVCLVKAKQKAYTYLAYGDLSEKRLLEKLMRAGFSEDIALECVSAMKAAGYVDDERYCAALANDLANRRLYGPRRVYSELLQKGVPEYIAREWETLCECDFEENIKTLATGKFRDKKDFSKLVTALMRYGYGYDMIRSAVSVDDEEYYD